MKEKVWDLFVEFEEGQTKEAKFARAIDNFDALIHELDYKKRWKGWTKEMVRKFHGEVISGFPELKEAFEKTTKYAEEQGYFDQ